MIYPNTPKNCHTRINGMDTAGQPILFRKCYCGTTAPCEDKNPPLFHLEKVEGKKWPRDYSFQVINQQLAEPHGKRQGAHEDVMTAYGVLSIGHSHKELMGYDTEHVVRKEIDARVDAWERGEDYL